MSRVPTSHFPVPFGGISESYGMRNRTELAKIVQFLIEEDPHEHNFAVACDGNTIHLSRLGAECLLRYIESDSFQ